MITSTVSISRVSHSFFYWSEWLHQAQPPGRSYRTLPGLGRAQMLQSKSTFVLRRFTITCQTIRVIQNLVPFNANPVR